MRSIPSFSGPSMRFCKERPIANGLVFAGPSTTVLPSGSRTQMLVLRWLTSRPTLYVASCRIGEPSDQARDVALCRRLWRIAQPGRSEEHTSELQSLMRISYAVFCLKKKKQNNKNYKLTKTQTKIDK